MKGILKIAFKLLVNDKGKFAALLIGHYLRRFFDGADDLHICRCLERAPLPLSSTSGPKSGSWILRSPPSPTSIPMPDYVQDAVRSIDGVKYAVPLYSGGATLKLRSGATSLLRFWAGRFLLVGRPELLEGNIEDIFAENGFIVVKDAEIEKLENPHIGTEFELNDNRGVIVGIAKVAANGLFGIPTLYTTYNRAIQYIPTARFTTSYILVEPQNASTVGHIKQEVRKMGYLAVTNAEFRENISTYYKYKTGLGTNILLMTLISFVVGLSISGQTFYTFILENLDKFGALKAIGAKSRELIVMIVFQAGFTALTGYGIGSDSVR